LKMKRKPTNREKLIFLKTLQKIYKKNIFKKWTKKTKNYTGEKQNLWMCRGAGRNYFFSL